MAKRPKAEKEINLGELEQNLEALESLVEQLEAGDLPLEKAVQEFERGIKLTRACQAVLKEAEQKVEILLKDSDAPVPFEDASASDDSD